MTTIKSQISISLDGYGAGPDNGIEHPLGIGGEQLHEWAFGKGNEAEQQIKDQMHAGIGAFLMGRGMFGGGPGEWREGWRGWWGDEPPYHAPVFVLTHHPREPLEMDGGTTFFFVTDGFESGLGQARDAAAGQDVLVAGGPSTINQGLRAGAIDELFLHVAPVILGGGERLFVDVGDPGLEPVEAFTSPVCTHVRYVVRR